MVLLNISHHQSISATSEIRVQLWISQLPFDSNSFRKLPSANMTSKFCSQRSICFRKYLVVAPQAPLRVFTTAQKDLSQMRTNTIEWKGPWVLWHHKYYKIPKCFVFLTYEVPTISWPILDIHSLQKTKVVEVWNVLNCSQVSIADRIPNQGLPTKIFGKDCFSAPGYSRSWMASTSTATCGWLPKRTWCVSTGQVTVGHFSWRNQWIRVAKSKEKPKTRCY